MKACKAHWFQSLKKESIAMAKNQKNNKSGSWKKERASVNAKNSSRSRSNKYRPGSDSSERPGSSSASRYWRAGYTRKDGTKVKGHYVNKPQ
jgi:hypothetical protein